MGWEIVKGVIDTVTGLVGAGTQVAGVATQAKAQSDANAEAKRQFDLQQKLERELAEKQNQQNKYAIDETNKANLDIANRTNELNKAIADQNLQFQKEQQAYEEALQQKLFEREDTSYQRTANDMRQAGMSPLAMSGTNGAGQAVARTAQNNEMQYQTGAPMQANRYERATTDALGKAQLYQASSDISGQVLSEMGNQLSNLLAIRGQHAEILKKEAEAEAIQRDNEFYGINGKAGYEAEKANKEYNYRETRDNINSAWDKSKFYAQLNATKSEADRKYAQEKMEAEFEQAYKTTCQQFNEAKERQRIKEYEYQKILELQKINKENEDRDFQRKQQKQQNAREWTDKGFKWANQVSSELRNWMKPSLKK